MGHSAPPTRIRYHGQNGQQILSAGEIFLDLNCYSYWLMMTKTENGQNNYNDLKSTGIYTMC